jgi:hypothetical protein
LIIYLVVIAVYLTGCLIIRLRDNRDNERNDNDGGSCRSAPRQGGTHAIHL